jgi:hypothetical protein
MEAPHPFLSSKTDLPFRRTRNFDTGLDQEDVVPAVERVGTRHHHTPQSLRAGSASRGILPYAARQDPKAHTRTDVRLGKETSQAIQQESRFPALFRSSQKETNTAGRTTCQRHR